ncbi:hypothetical protein NC653_040319 [Populus alba x Populus x berolinensis]|uniref:ATP-dependent RNA helicase Ski2/MTR4 C-terminal domain-containing protein n=1 Tax=Populus alba x Populus x berolinensis TaxID=444605 RepID=A0AAD6PRM2_9ROSI|nr:hypothetical protein NC653_040319 [Populus alba x Populus x berolinensis]
MKDRERGVVWQASIIFMPPEIKMVFLSATMSNATEFDEWICHLHKQPCHVVYTDFRPTPLQHYVFPVGGAGLYLVVDESEQFREDNCMKLQDTFSKQKIGEGNKSANGKASGRIAKGGNTSGGSDIYKIVKLQKFREELKNRSRVLKRLGHIDADGVVQLKGRAACLIDTGDELLVTELMFNGTFNDLDHHQVAALASCFIPVDKSSEQIQLRTELAKPLQQLQESA